jgi:hypothetical protein
MWMCEWEGGRLMVTLWVVFRLSAGIVNEKAFERPRLGAVVIVIFGINASLVPT